MTTGIDLPKALDAIPVVATATDRDTRYPTPATNQRVYRLDTGNVELWTGAAWSITLAGQTEGTWTPVMTGATTAGTFTYTGQVGRYIRLGNMVCAWAYLATSGTSVAAVGTISVTGLPFASSNIASLYQPAVIGEIDGITFGAGFSEVVSFLLPNTTNLVLSKVGSAQSAVALTGADLAPSWALMVSITYRTD